jgi:hypothetical protein
VIAATVLSINTRLGWIPLDYGAPLQDLPALGIRRYSGVVSPLVVTYGVDEARRVVSVVVPFKLLPKSGS